MQATVTTSNGLERVVNFTVPAQDFEKALDEKINYLAKNRRVAGFRPGKIPRSVARKYFGAEANNAAFNDIVDNSLREFFSNNNVNPAGRPSIKVTQWPANDKEAIFEASFEVMPEINLADFKSVNIEKPVCTVNDSDVDELIEKLRHMRATWNETDAAIENGNKVKAEVQMFVEDKPVGAKPEPVELIIGNANIIPELNAAFVGHKKGDKFDVNIKVPESYPNKEFVGKDAVYKLEVKEVMTAILPEVNADFIKALDVKSGEVEDFRNTLRTNMENQLKPMLKSRVRSVVYEALLKANNIEMPKSLVQATAQQNLDNDVANYKKRMKHEPKLPADIINTYKARAENDLRLSLIVENLISKNNIAVNTPEVKSLIEDDARLYDTPDEFVKYQLGDANALARYREIALENKVVDFVLSQANVTEKSLKFSDVVNSRQ